MSLLATREKTLEQKLARLTDILVNYAKSKQIKPEDANDIAQEAIKDICKDKERIEETAIRELLPWVFAVMQREIYMFFRTKRRKQNLRDKVRTFFSSNGSNHAALNQTEEHILKQERRQLVRKVLADLSPVERKLYELTIGGLCGPEIARELGVSALCVRKKQSRLRKLLTQKLSFQLKFN